MSEPAHPAPAPSPPPGPAAPPGPPPRSPGFLRRSAKRFARYRLGVAGLAAVGAMFLVAFLSPTIANNQPIVCRYEGKIFFPAVVDTIAKIPFASKVVRKDKPFRFPGFDFKASFDSRRSPKPDWAIWAPIPYGPMELTPVPFAKPSRRHWLGTDEVGRDVASRMVHGTSVSMRVGFLSMGIAAIVGLTMGGLAGYLGGWTDLAISRFIEVVTCFPTFFLVLGILAWFPPRIENVMIVIGLTGWTGIARYARGEIMKLREQDYALAARAMGAGTLRIVFRHLLPNSLAPVMVSLTFGIASAILVESALSWLGFGVQPPAPSWGNILRSGYENLLTAPFLVPPPCVAIFVAVLAFNLVGDALRDAIDPRLDR